MMHIEACLRIRDKIIQNIASGRAMEKDVMVQYDTEDNGDPLFRFAAKE